MQHEQSIHHKIVIIIPSLKISGVRIVRLERINIHKFKIFLTFDDLVERGFTKEELWYNFPKANHMFQDMLFEASSELGIEIDGNLNVEIHFLQAQGMLIVVTQDFEFLDEDFIEMKVTFDENKEFMFCFDSFEDIIQVCTYLNNMGIQGGTIYYWEQHYYMELDSKELEHVNPSNVIAIMSEYSSPTAVTSVRLKEYGKTVMEDQAVAFVLSYFSNNK